VFGLQLETVEIGFDEGDFFGVGTFRELLEYDRGDIDRVNVKAFFAEEDCMPSASTCQIECLFARCLLVLV
jgi:hypothetical protein